MKKRRVCRIMTTFISIVMILSSVLPAFAQADDQITVAAARYYLSPYDEAVSSLEDITADRNIDALIYLCDAYGLKEEADPNSATLATIASGQSVAITGVSQDSGKNIWYKVSYSYCEEVISGYIEREYLASADERFLEWEATYVCSRLRSLFRSTYSTADIEQFPVSYQDALSALKQEHPNWTFVKMNTNLDWNAVVNAECYKDRNLIQARYALASWMNGMYDSSWAYCSPDIVKYYLDPRNFLDETSVFQFEHLVYNESVHSEKATQLVLNGSFMSGTVKDTSRTYANVFMEAGKANKVSPILLASRVKQEQGVNGTSPLISGTYPGYENLYNYYNIGASGQKTEAVIISGLQKAREKGWTTRESSLIGGAYFLAVNYIYRGQDTLYLQKFDVDSSDGTLYTHQYMQNIQAPASEAQSTYKAYKNINLLSESPFVFKIPVYNNMPSYAVTKPGSKEVLTLSTTTVTNLPVDQTAVLNTYLNGSMNTAVAMDFSSSNTAVATVDSNGVITGIGPGTATITCKRMENPEMANTVTCSVSVVKADISLSAVTKPDIEAVTYDPGQTLADVTLPQGYTWVDSSITPTVDNQGYSVIYNPDNSKYNSLTFSLSLTVKKAQIPQTDIKVPTDLESAAGQELSTVALPQGFAWEEPGQVLPKKIGTYPYKATYSTDIANYESAKDIDINVTVICTAHEFSDWSGTHADCTHDGTLERECSICGEKETIHEDALGHLYVSEITKEPTATKTGIRTFICEHCKDTYTEVIPATGSTHEHSFTSKVTKEATCLETGILTYTCSCGYTYDETTEALGHNIVNGACTRCDYTEPSLPVHAHSYTLSGTTATCTEAGINTYTCSCGAFYTEETAALGHDLVNGVCSRCGYTVPTPSPTAVPTTKPTATPTTKPTATPTAVPTTKPTATPTAVPTTKPTATPTAVPTTKPTAVPTTKPTATPTAVPTQVKPEITSIVTPTPVPTQAKPEITSIVTPTPVPTQAKPEITSIVTPTPVPTQAKVEITSIVTPTAEPNQVKPEITTIASPTTAVTPAVQKAPSAVQKVTPVPATASEITPVVTPQPLNTVRINMQEESILSASKIGELSDKDENLQLIMADNVTWYIDISSIADKENLNVDMDVTIGKADIPETAVEAAAEDKPYEVLSLAYDGPFEFDATLAIPVKEEYQGMIANLLYYNPDTNNFEFIGAAKVSDEGYAAFNMKHASDYMIIFADASLETEYIQQSETTDSLPEAVEASSQELKAGLPITNIILIIVILGLIVAVIVISVVMFQIHNRKQAIEDAEYEEYLEEERKMAEEAAKEAAKVKKEISIKQQQKKEDEYYLDEDDFLD